MRFDRLVLMVVLLVLPVAFWPGSTSYDAAKFTLLALAGACWLGNLAWRLGMDRPIRRPPARLLAAGASLLLVLVVSALQAHHVGLVFRTVLLTALWLAVIFQTAITIDNPARMRLALTTVVASGVIISVYGLTQIAGLLPGAPAASGYPLGISTLGNQNYLSGLAAVLLWPSVILWSQPSARRRSAAVAATIILAVTVILARAMGPVIAVIGSFFLVMPCLVMARSGKSSKVPLVLGSSLLLATVLGSVLLGEAMRPPPATQDEPPAIHRKIFLENHGAIRRTDWLVAKEMFRTSPWTGRGAGNYPALWPVTRAKLYADPTVTGLTDHDPRAVRAHNEVFQFLGETGLLGGTWLLVSALAGVWFWRQRWRKLPDSLRGTDFLLLTAGLLVAGIHGMVSFPFHLPATALVLAMVVGLMASPAFSGTDTTPAVRRGIRFLAVAPAALAMVLLVGSLREFTGDLHLAAGQRHFAAARLSQAASHLEKGVDLRQWPELGHLYLGLVRVAVGDQEGARPALENSIRENPTFEGYLALAELSIDQGRFAEADRLLATVENCEPFVDFRIQAAYLRGLAELRQGNHAESRRLFRELLETDPDNQRTWLALGYLEVLDENPGQAGIFYRRALEIIDRKLQQSARDQTLESIGSTARLKMHRLAAVRALESVP